MSSFTVRHNRIELAVHRLSEGDGAGRPLLLLHGLGECTPAEVPLRQLSGFVWPGPVLGLDFTVEQVPDATTLLHFRHLLEKHELGRKLLESQGEIFEEQGWIMRGGTIVDAPIIAAPSPHHRR